MVLFRCFSAVSLWHPSKRFSFVEDSDVMWVSILVILIVSKVTNNWMLEEAAERVINQILAMGLQAYRPLWVLPLLSLHKVCPLNRWTLQRLPQPLRIYVAHAWNRLPQADIDHLCLCPVKLETAVVPPAISFCLFFRVQHVHCNALPWQNSTQN